MDKSTWGDGPWQTEPDREEWRSHGFACLVRRAGHGALCGYVAIPPGHPWHGKMPDADAHGGVNYAEPCHDDVCHVPAPGESDDVWWIGFDCAHAGDFTPAMMARLRELAPELTALMVSGDRPLVYCTLDYVRAEVESLAAQAAGAT